MGWCAEKRFTRLLRRGLRARCVQQEEDGRQNRTLRLPVVTPGYWSSDLPEQSNVPSLSFPAMKCEDCDALK